jgi:iron complex outermembrane receptor protein
VRTGIASLALLCLLFRPLEAQDGVPDQDPSQDDIDIEDLMKVQVTSLAKREQPLEDVPAALSVVRGDDLHRMGVTSIPEALRGVPGMQVARSRSHTWAVSARGFTDNSSNKLLAMIDGRSVYSPLHSGIFWDVQDTFLEDIDRIEVIRGPGGSLWGSNAVNGIVNVITRSAEHTQGAVVVGGGGTEEKAFGGVRYGFKVDEDFFLRVYTKYFSRDEAALGTDPDEVAFDYWWMGRAGFRGDLKSGDRDRFTFTGDGYTGQVREKGNDPSLTSPAGSVPFDNRADLRGGHLLFRWDREVDAKSSFTFQAYIDRTERDTELFQDLLHTGDLDFQHRYRWSEAHDVLWGLGYRIYRVDFDGEFAIQLDPGSRTDDLVSAFVQDEITLSDAFKLTIGSKFEHNDYTGFEYQPSARLAWKADDRNTVWASASRAVRTPSLIDVDLTINAFVIPGSPPTVTGVFGSDDFESETLIAYEAGWRTRPADFLTADVAVFSNRYDHLRSITPGSPFLDSGPPQHLVIPFNLGNDLDAKSWGIETSTAVRAAGDLRFQASYAYLRINFSDDASEGRDPQHTAWVRASYEPGPGWTVDAMGRYVSRLKAFDIDGYIEADLRIAWKPEGERMEIALVGQNLMRESHAEFQAEASRNEIERGAYLSLTWGF